MTYRKTWFSCVLWILYTILCVVLLVFAGNVWVSYFAGIPYAKGFQSGVFQPFKGLPDHILFLLGLLIIPVFAAFYWVVRVIAGQIRKKYLFKERTTGLLECAIVLAAVAAGVFLRVDWVGFLLRNVENGSAAPYISGMEYYDMAVIRESGSVTPMAYGAAYLYVLCLSAALSFLGNKLVSALAVQVFLQVVGLILAYTVTRKSAGRLPACLTLIYLAFSAGYQTLIGLLGPECLFFDLYLIGMLILVSFVKKYCANGFSRLTAVLGAFGTGLVIGLLAYLDLAAVTILLLVTAVATGRKQRQEGNPACASAGFNGAVILTTVIAGVAGTLGLSGIISLCRGSNPLADMETWAALQIGNTHAFGFGAGFPYWLDIYAIGVLIIFAAFLVFEFFRSGKEQNYMLWILLCIVAAPTPLASIGVQPFGIISLYIWTVLAGLGLQNCMFGGSVKVMQAVIEEINSAAELSEKESEASEKTEDTESVTGRISPDEAGGKTVPEEKMSEQIQKPRYIENPLPLPKKHVKKEMDYQYPVEEKDMKYDVDVPENDDFDLL